MVVRPLSHERRGRLLLRLAVYSTGAYINPSTGIDPAAYGTIAYES